jgi:vanillate O-demethylase ferredoxin subunit
MLSVIVDGLWRQGDKSLAVRLVAENGETLPAGSPGRTLMSICPAGGAPVFPDRTCGDESYLICVGRETASRGGSRYIHETLRPGRSCDLSPRNLFPLHQAERVVLLAAGIGITPLYAMALQLEASGTPFTLHYYVKNVKTRRLSAKCRVGGVTASASFTPPAREKAHARGLARICQQRMTGYMYTPAAHSNLWPKSVT